jgi:hypothetical protein
LPRSASAGETERVDRDAGDGSVDALVSNHTWFPSGRVVFSKPNSGYDGDQELAAKHLNVGVTYIVARESIGESHSSVQLVEYPGIWFNTVLFEDAK